MTTFNPAAYLTKEEQMHLELINQKLDVCKTLEEVEAYEYSVCLILQKSLKRYEAGCLINE